MDPKVEEDRTPLRTGMATGKARSAEKCNLKWGKVQDWAQTLLPSRWSWLVGAPGPSQTGPALPGPASPPADAGAEPGEGPGPVPVHMRTCIQSSGTHPPCSGSRDRQRAASPFSPALAAEAAGFHRRKAGVQATPPRGVPRELKTEGAAAARWPLALSWRDKARRGSDELSAAFVLIVAPFPKPKTALQIVGTQ